MPVSRAKNGRWRYRAQIRLPDGTKPRISGTAPLQFNTKAAALQAERDHIARVQKPTLETRKKEVPTYDDWFNGRFWREWVVARKNKPTEVRSKKIIYRVHIKPVFGEMRLDKIGDGEIADFRAQLVETVSRFGRPLSAKRINNILAVLSKPLHYAQRCKLIQTMPEIGIFKVERPEIEAWEFEQYARVLAAAKIEGPEWYAAACLAGEAGLRAGEIKALRWREDVDLIARTVTVNFQTCNGETTTPKGRTRRTIPMTPTLVSSLKRLETVREGLVIRNLDGTAKRDSQANHTIGRILRRAGLPVRGWHSLRHAFGTHAAHFGVNPWRLQAWMGHKRIDETMLYVHVAHAHGRELPEGIREAGNGIADPDQRVIAMLGARGNHVATGQQAATGSLAISAA
jgi:integrase